MTKQAVNHVRKYTTAKKPRECILFFGGAGSFGFSEPALRHSHDSRHLFLVGSEYSPSIFSIAPC
jgi:hypothetical protein